VRALITGAGGTVGSALRRNLEERGAQLLCWDRRVVSCGDPRAMESFLRAERPDVLFHLAIASQPTGMANEPWAVNVEWPTALARITGELNIRFLFTSTVMVFSNDAKGPFTPESQPDAAEGYGHEKRVAEQRVLSQNPGATVVRLGWQIGDAPRGNNMLEFFESHMRDEGMVRASRRWLPACSFLSDTAEALAGLVDSPPGLHMLDSNERWSFFEIAAALNALHGNRWRIEPTDDFVYDQRMVDPAVKMPSLKERLSGLP
jgi:dTDP-4-dehydrorhamnose reductase